MKMRGLTLCLMLALTKGAFSASTGASDVCKVAGDPFYTTFDGARIEFQGKCVYNFASYGDCHSKAKEGEGESEDVTKFNVYVENTATPHDETRSYTSMAHVDVLNHRISLRENGRVLVDELEKTLELSSDPYYVNDDNTIYITKVDNLVTVVVVDKFIVTWDARGPYGRHVVTIQILDDKYKGVLGGICGDYNGDENDDHRPKGSDQIAYASDTEIGNSWIANAVECL